jgi:large subunit ribosomal protein L21
MYAVIEDSGTQFKVSEGDIIRVDLREMPEDSTSIEFDRVLLLGGEGEPKIGTPRLDGAKVTADVLTEVRGEKITIIKFRRRKGYRRKKGHRQRFLRVRITGINA